VEIFLTTEAWIALLTLTFLEVVLGIDNIIFISIVTNKLPEHQQGRGRFIGLSLALVFRLLLLSGIAWLVQMKQPIFSIQQFDFSFRDLVLLAGGLFLIFKSTTEIHHHLEGETQSGGDFAKNSFAGVILQIVVLDLIFSFDSILTAVGLTEHLLIMVIAIILGMVIMLLSSKGISSFIKDHPTLQVLALSFLILIGFMLGLEAFHHHIPKGYIYFAVFFSLMVEVLNLRLLKRSNPISLNKRLE
jgi:predicted tellurium resistance membrane protein TerC